MNDNGIELVYQLKNDENVINDEKLSMSMYRLALLMNCPLILDDDRLFDICLQFIVLAMNHSRSRVGTVGYEFSVNLMNIPEIFWDLSCGDLNLAQRPDLTQTNQQAEEQEPRQEDFEKNWIFNIDIPLHKNYQKAKSILVTG